MKNGAKSIGEKLKNESPSLPSKKPNEKRSGGNLSPRNEALCNIVFDVPVFHQRHIEVVE